MPNSAFCIDLIFANKPNLRVESDIFPSLHVKCHHQIVYSKLNLNVVYSPPYQHMILDYKRSNVDYIRKSVNSINLGFVLSGKNVHQRSMFFITIYQITLSQWIKKTFHG